VNRGEVIKALSQAHWGVNPKDLVQAFKSFCFHGDLVTACNNDIQGVQTSLPFDGLKGGCEAKPLLAWLRSHKVTNLSWRLDDDDNFLIFKCGRSTLKVEYMGLEHFRFEVPIKKKEERCQSVDVNGVVSSLGLAAMVMGRDATRRYIYGVTLDFHERGTWVYSSDNVSMYRGYVADWIAPESMIGKSILINPEYVDLFLKVSKTSHLDSFYINDGHFMSIGSEETRTFTVLKGKARPDAFQSVCDRIKWKAGYTTINPKFHQILERQKIVADGTKLVFTRFKKEKSDKGRCNVTTGTGSQQVVDSIEVGGVHRYDMLLPCDLVAKLSKKCTKMRYFQDIGLALTGPSGGFVISKVDPN
jgi:hypothetical protein